MTHRRRLRRAAAVLVGLLAAALLVFRPPAPQRLPTLPGQPTLWQGAYHVHTTRSDGSGTPDATAAAARAAGLDFVILTDHGDATRVPDPPRYVAGVLLIDGVEISTEDGHYVAIGLRGAPYPLAGEGRAVAEDVRRLGGIGILAHPDSPRPSLAWTDWSTDADGFEWVNADSAWRSASTPSLIGALLAYPLRPSAAVATLATYRSALVARLDQPTQRPQLALAAVDAHARIGWRREADPQDDGGTLVRLPSYAASFGSFGLVVPWHGASPSRDAALDGQAVVDAIGTRLAYSAVFSMAQPTWLELELLEPLESAQPGPDAQSTATLAVRGNVPLGGRYRVLRNGVPWRDLHPGDASVRLPADSPAAVYRAEAWLPARRGWPALPLAVSAARTHNVTPRGARSASVDGHARQAMSLLGWHVEHSEGSSVTLHEPPAAEAVSATLRLAGGGRASQFSALAADMARVPDGVTGLEMRLTADQPTRVSIQLRQPVAGEGLRWRHSAYVDQQPRVVSLRLDEFRPIRPASGAVPIERAHALLLVLDTVNGRPGGQRRLTVDALRWIGPVQ